MYEKSHQPLAPPKKFAKRLLRSFTIGLLLIAASLFIGVAGYHWIGDLSWIDSLLNASMILTGMGPVNPMTTDSAKIFASCYAIFSGVIFLTTVGVMLAPLAHRLMHKFHIKDR
jgi:hypothetical protein